MKKFIPYALASVFLMASPICECAVAQKVPESYWSLEYNRFCLDGHHYIHFTNPWYGHGDLIIHDPDCKSCDEPVTLEDILEEIKNTCHATANPHDLDVFFQEIRQTILTVQSKEHSEEKKKKDKDKSKKDKHKD